MAGRNMTNRRIKRDDIVQVISGKDRGKRGRILRVIPETGRVVVENVNMVKRHTKQRSQTQPGGIVEKEAPIEASNVMLFCPKCNKRTRVRVTVLADKTKERTCKGCGEIV